MRTTVTIILASAALLTACASRPPVGQPISSTQGSVVVRRAQVTKVRDVTLQGNRSSGLGSVAGAVLGGVAGSLVGGGTGSAIASVGGAVAGGMAGQHVERAADTAHTTEITVRFDNGDMRSYSIGPDESFRVGDVVAVRSGYGGTRITYENAHQNTYQHTHQHTNE